MACAVPCNATKDKECETLSDYYRGQQRPNDPFRSPNADWQSDGGTDFLTDDPAQLGAQMQQGGVPLFQDAQPDFFAQGDDAPTRVARPVVPPQTAVRRSAAERTRTAETPEAEAAPSAQSAAPARRRSRVAERAEKAAEGAAPAQTADPFRAGDSEMQPQRRTAEAGARYMGARTAMPQGGQRPARPAAGQAPQQGAQRPMQPRPAQGGQRPQHPQQPRPQQGQRPVRPMQEGEARRTAVRPDARMPKDEMYRRQPAAEAPRYQPEYEEEDEEPKGRRKKSALVPVLIILIVLIALALGICLPDWKAIGGPVGGFVAPVQETVTGFVNGLKNKVFPEEEPIKSLSATAADSVAPTRVLFTVQTSKNVEGVCIKDDLGNTVYQAAYDAEKEKTGEIIANSNVLLWNASANVTDAYTGGYTAYAVKDGAVQESGVAALNTVSIAAPKIETPAVQAFSADTVVSAVPVTVTFSVTTSDEVSAVRVVDGSNTAIVTLYDTDGEGLVFDEENGTRQWTLSAEVRNAYTGVYGVQTMSKDSLSFTPSTYTVAVQLGAEPAVAATYTPEPAATATPTPEPTATPTPTPEPTPSPTPTPEPTPTPVPTTSPLPSLSAAAASVSDPSAIGLKATLYNGSKTVSTYNRSRAISLLNAFTTKVGGSDYAGWRQAGVLTFRSGPLRQNAAYGTVEVENEKLTLVWSQPIGSMKTSESTVYGVAYPGQPVIVKWPTELRKNMGIKDEMKDVTALKEAIVAGQDGKVHFFNLLTGELTRDPIDIGAPSRGGLSVATNGTPILGVGQYNSKLPNKSVKNGYHLLNLVTNKKEMLIAGDGKDKNSNYSGVTGAALFDSTTGTMIVGAQNGVLYTAELGTVKNAYNYALNQVSLDDDIQGYKTQAEGQKKVNTNIDASVAMYNNYVYYGDQAGIVQCVDVNTLTPVWAVDTEDNIDSTPALDVEGETVALYTGNTILNRTAKSAVCTIRRLDALTGKTVWVYEVPELTYVKKQDVGVYASPVVGQGSIRDLVIFTVTNGKSSAKVIALNKADGKVVWETALESGGKSSPVAVYSETGDAWLVQAESNGKIHLMNAKTGKIVDTLQLTLDDAEAELTIEASPAAYGNLVVIGTTGKKAGGVYCIKID